MQRSLHWAFSIVFFVTDIAPCKTQSKYFSNDIPESVTLRFAVSSGGTQSVQIHLLYLCCVDYKWQYVPNVCILAQLRRKFQRKNISTSHGNWPDSPSVFPIAWAFCPYSGLAWARWRNIKISTSNCLDTRVKCWRGLKPAAGKHWLSPIITSWKQCRCQLCSPIDRDRQLY